MWRSVAKIRRLYRATNSSDEQWKRGLDTEGCESLQDFTFICGSREIKGYALLLASCSDPLKKTILGTGIMPSSRSWNLTTDKNPEDVAVFINEVSLHNAACDMDVDDFSIFKTEKSVQFFVDVYNSCQSFLLKPFYLNLIVTHIKQKNLKACRRWIDGSPSSKYANRMSLYFSFILPVLEIVHVHPVKVLYEILWYVLFQYHYNDEWLWKDVLMIMVDHHESIEHFGDKVQRLLEFGFHVQHNNRLVYSMLKVFLMIANLVHLRYMDVQLPRDEVETCVACMVSRWHTSAYVHSEIDTRSHPEIATNFRMWLMHSDPRIWYSILSKGLEKGVFPEDFYEMPRGKYDLDILLIFMDGIPPDQFPPAAMKWEFVQQFFPQFDNEECQLYLNNTDRICQLFKIIYGDYDRLKMSCQYGNQKHQIVDQLKATRSLHSRNGVDEESPRWRAEELTNCYFEIIKETYAKHIGRIKKDMNVEEPSLTDFLKFLNFIPDFPSFLHFKDVAYTTNYTGQYYVPFLEPLGAHRYILTVEYDNGVDEQHIIAAINDEQAKVEAGKVMFMIGREAGPVTLKDLRIYDK